jgi:hypothetical protein
MQRGRSLSRAEPVILRRVPLKTQAALSYNDKRGYAWLLTQKYHIPLGSKQERNQANYDAMSDT